ncbi:hypothetical protein NGRA_0468 [Nosema granulosis]|uniref:Uncharacterized protein n=1 Tax=Nosema granulosis TaxID=83296 RepID=A0A9P6L0B7_9MICR|nr:hypothetical protein NGRA_0468 [Nosema granulosis]
MYISYYLVVIFTAHESQLVRESNHCVALNIEEENLNILQSSKIISSDNSDNTIDLKNLLITEKNSTNIQSNNQTIFQKIKILMENNNIIAILFGIMFICLGSTIAYNFKDVSLSSAITSLFLGLFFGVNIVIGAFLYQKKQ